jgi:hypothetical protein
MMKPIIATLALCLTGGIANAATVTLDFDQLRGNISGLDLGGVLITAGTSDVPIWFSRLGSFALVNQNSFFGIPSLDNLFRADFSVAGVSAVSIEMGDGRSIDSDVDIHDLILEAYDKDDVLLASSFATILSTFEIYLPLAVSAPNISYVRFGGVDRKGLNTIYADNLSFTYDPPIAPVPLPASAVLLAGALGLLAMARRRHTSPHSQAMLQRSV